ncbi:MAG: nicotinate-nucleotide adenylyltransferase [Acidimicrobiales bacterium]|jgi:nicotinate-nucleotide adenylyltransferase
MRIGVFGGTFDPIHVGHLVAAVNARHTLGLDRVLFVVANEPWQKVGDRPVSPALDRLTLVDAALGDVDGLEASRLEIDRGGPSYTVDTIEELRRLEPTADLYLIVGADVIAGLATWERLDDVRRETTMVVVNRPGSTPVLPGQDGPLAGWNAVAIEIPALEISSTDLRERAATGRPLDYLIPEGAVRMIKQRGLYARDR